MSDDPVTDRLWQHLLHDDDIFNHRLSFFLVIQSVLVALAGLLYQRNPGTKLILILSGLGFLLTAIWQYVQARQYYVLQILKNQVKTAMPDYAETLEARHGKWPISSTLLLAYVPSLFLVLWLSFILYFTWRH